MFPDFVSGGYSVDDEVTFQLEGGDQVSGQLPSRLDSQGFENVQL